MAKKNSKHFCTCTRLLIKSWDDCLVILSDLLYFSVILTKKKKATASLYGSEAIIILYELLSSITFIDYNFFVML